MSFDRDVILAQIEQDQMRFHKLVNGTATEDVVLEDRTVGTIQKQLDAAISSQIVQADQAVVDAEAARDAAQTAESGSVAAKDLSRLYAEEAEDVEVAPGEYSSKHHRNKAAASATAAQGSADAAALSESAAGGHASSAGLSAAEAEGHKDAAESSALASAQSAADSEGSAQASETARLAAVAALESFLGTYYGPDAGDPALDPNGDAPTTGDVYFNSTDGELKVFNGTIWRSFNDNLASAVLVNPVGAITATDVQGALEELDQKKVPRTGVAGAALLPAGATVDRPAPQAGMFRYNSELEVFEGYTGAGWGGVGGATGAGGNPVFYENDQVVTGDYTIPGDKNAMSTGPITINDDVTVTISDGARWVIL